MPLASNALDSCAKDNILSNSGILPTRLPSDEQRFMRRADLSVLPNSLSHGQAIGNPVVSGRITGIAAGPGGRVYAGTANGGVWFSADHGMSWTPLYEWFWQEPIPPAGEHADSLSVGTIAVRFGAQRANDLLFVGTGEPMGGYIGYFGVGIKVSTDGGQTFLEKLEAKNIAGAGIYRIVIDPDGAADPIALAAASNGLYRRPPSGSSRDEWVQTMTGAATDAVVAGTGAGKTWYAAFGTLDSKKVYWSTDATSWTGIAGITAPAGRISLAVAESNAAIVYALTSDANGEPLLFRREGNNDFLLVTLPSRSGFRNIQDLFGDTAPRQGDYDNVVAVDPSDANQVYLAGAAVYDQLVSNLALFGAVVDVTNPLAPSLTNVAYLGRGIHPDAHCLAFETKAVGGHDASVVWIGTDGGPFCSTQTAALGTFDARNDGLAVTQLTYLAHRLDTDAVLISGCQDNGTIRFRGEPAWYEVVSGDGGGVAIDPNDPRRMMCQGNYAKLKTCTDGALSADSWLDLWTGDLFPPTPIKADKATESGNTLGYTRIRAIDAGTGVTLAAFGTNRLWVTTDWGATWTTLPSNTNPFDATGPAKFTQDKLDSSIVDICLVSATSILVATRKSAYRLTYANNAWSPDPPQAMLPAGLPAGVSLTSIAVANAATGSFYLGVGGTGSYDRVWYYDGTNWSGTRPISGTGIPDVPVNALAVDPANTNVVYAGTDVGVWKGTKAANAASWTWEIFSFGLPEAAVLDLAIHPQARLLRAATHGVGAWEISLDATSALATDVYLRAHDADSGRRFAWAANVPDPAAATGYATVAASPDIRVCRSSKPLPAAPLDFVAFANLDIAARVVDATGTNRIFVQVHNRGTVTAGKADVSVLLLLAAADGGVPPLPADFATRIRNKDATNWLGATGWKFAYANAPYQSLAGDLSARVAQVVAFDVDLSSWSVTKGWICAAAFVTAANDQISGSDPNLQTALATNKYVAVRMLQVASTTAYWRDSGLTTPRVNYTGVDSVENAIAVLRDGGVLLTGLTPGFGDSADRYRSLSNAWTPPPAAKGANDVWETATALNDGRVLLTRRNSVGSTYYDPATNSFADAPDRHINFAFSGPLRTRLADGSVLLIGVSGLSPNAELFNARTKKWEVVTSTPGLYETPFGTATLLADGRVLVLGPDTGMVVGANIFDPASGQVTSLTLPANLTLPMASHAATRLGDRIGTVLITGGQNQSGVVTNSVFAYNPTSGAWAQKAPMSQARALHTATLLDDGTVLVVAESCLGGPSWPRRNCTTFPWINGAPRRQ